MRQTNEIGSIYFREEEIKLSHFTVGTILYIENPKEPTKKSFRTVP
jgi:hypothetical protein